MMRKQKTRTNRSAKPTGAKRQVRNKAAARPRKATIRTPLYQRQYNQAFDQAYNKGFDDGYAKGLEDGAIADKGQ